MLNSNHLQGKVSIVTGAAGAIGYATIRLMLARGARVVAVDRDAAGLAAMSREFRDPDALLTMEADVTDELAVREYVRRVHTAMGRIDVLFNNAGIEGGIHPIPDFPLGLFEKVLAVNVVGVFLGMKHVIPIMVAQGGGSIINASSVAGLVSLPGLAAYSASKHAVIGLTKTAALEWAAKGVRVNCTNPGPISGRMMNAITEGMAPGSGAEVERKISESIPAGRYGTPEEVATLVAFLASDDARYITGASIVTDGGVTAS